MENKFLVKADVLDLFNRFQLVCNNTNITEGEKDKLLCIICAAIKGEAVGMMNAGLTEMMCVNRAFNEINQDRKANFEPDAGKYVFVKNSWQIISFPPQIFETLDNYAATGSKIENCTITREVCQTPFGTVFMEGTVTMTCDFNVVLCELFPVDAAGLDAINYNRILFKLLMWLFNAPKMQYLIIQHDENMVIKSFSETALKNYPQNSSDCRNLILEFLDFCDKYQLLKFLNYGR